MATVAQPLPHPQRAARLSARERLAATALAIVAGLTLANLAFNLIAAARGYGIPYDSFLADSRDRFGDFFGLLKTYPQGSLATLHDWSGLHAIVPEHPLSDTVAAWMRGLHLSHHHMMPLSNAAALGVLAAMRWVDPVATLLLVLGSLAAGWGVIATAAGRTPIERACWIALGCLSYPALLMVTRGNMFAGLCGLALVGAALLAIRGRAPIATALLLALAVNIRPNVILFALPLLAFHWRGRWRFAIALTIAGWAMLGASILVTRSLDPAYTVEAFRTGLANYVRVFAASGLGIAYSSSLYGGLWLLLGPDPLLNPIASITGVALAAAATACWATGRIGKAGFLFVVGAACCLGTTIVADYHLLAWLAVPLAIAEETDSNADPLADPTTRIMLIAACLLLAPKNYVFDGALSLQVMINPAVMLFASLAVLAQPRRDRYCATALPSLARPAA